MRMKISAVLAAIALSAPPALAHHGWAGQGTARFEVSGTLQAPVQLGGPHATLQIKDKNGQVWDATLSAPPRVEAAGLKKDTIPVGAQVTISGKRSLDAKRFEVKTERVTYQGRNFDVYPDRS